jgi:CAAX protease family protein
MNTQNISTKPLINFRLNTLSFRILIAWILGLMVLAFAGFFGELSEKYADLGQYRYELQAIIMSGLIVSGVWLLRKKLDKGSPKSIGIGNFRESLSKFALGISLIILPLFLTLSFTELFGWGSVTFNTNSALLSTLIIGVSTTFLFEALPEELLFRGYIYSNLNMQHKRWVSALITIGLFVLLPIFVVPIQKHILGMDIYVGGASSITASYIIMMFLFGSFIQYLRILTGSVWTGIGFHLVFVYINRLMGLEPTNLIQFSDFTNEVPTQITFGSALAITFIVLLLYPRIRKRKIGWGEYGQ